MGTRTNGAQRTATARPRKDSFRTKSQQDSPAHHFLDKQQPRGSHNVDMKALMATREAMTPLPLEVNAMAYPGPQTRTPPMSKSIKIKRNKNNDDAHSFSTSESSERMYDWATWRMYHRITSARRNRAAVMPMPSTEASRTVDDDSMFRSIAGVPMQGAPHPIAEEASHLHQEAGCVNLPNDQTQFEGVFAIDL